MVFNLLSNAAKFTEKGTITLTGRRGETKGRDWLEFSVTDTGIGIAPDKMQKVFGEFEQADTAVTRDFEGTGLGLYLVEEIIQETP